MLCVVNGITSVSIDGVEYKAEDNLIEIPDEAYKKVIHHPNIRAATSREIAALEKITAERKKAAEKSASEAAAKEAEKTAKKAAEEQAKLEAEAKAAKEATQKAAEAAEAQEADEAPKEAEAKGGGKHGGK